MPTDSLRAGAQRTGNGDEPEQPGGPFWTPPARLSSDPTYRRRPDVVDQLHRVAGRLNEPIRIALAGTLKSGKSTLVNALVGSASRPPMPPRPPASSPGSVTALPEGRRQPCRRQAQQCPDRAGGTAEGLTFDVGALDPDEVLGIDVDWPAPELVEATIIDTPGTAVADPGSLPNAPCDYSFHPTECRGWMRWCSSCAH